jgi:chromosomal replication initiator protein
VLIASVPVRFVQHWIENHYSDDLLECCASEFEGVQRVDIILRHPCMRREN